VPVHGICKCEEFYGGKQNELISNSTVFHIFGGYYKHQSYELRFGQFTFTYIYDFAGMENKPNYTSKNKPVVNLVWQKDINGIYLWCNEQFGIHGGKNPALVAGLTDYDFFPEKYAEKNASDDLKVIESGNSFEFEESTEKDGNSIWWRTRKFPVRDQNGIIIGVLGEAEDITWIKNAEKRYTENDARYKRLSENAEDIIFRFDLYPVQKLTYINPAVERITGFTPEECYSNQDISISNLHPDDIPFMLEMVNAGKVPEKPFTLRWQNKNDKWHWLESKVVSVNDKNGKLIAVEGITRDITEKKNIDDQIASERILLRTIIDTVPDALYVKDMQGNKILANKAEMNILNVNTIEEYFGKPDTEFYTQEAGAKYWADDLEVLNSRKPKLNIQELVIDRKGKEWWILASKVPLFDKAGNLQGIVGVGRDITERKKLQDELEKYKTHLEELVKERTKELEEKNKELQRMNDIFVGREFRIKELKEKIKILEDELGR
jgi:PAS domain S-box-containing protein